MKTNTLLLCLLLLFSACKSGQNEYVATSVGKEQLLEKYAKLDLNDERLRLAVELGFFLPELDSCSTKIEMQAPLQVSPLNNAPEGALDVKVAFLYQVFGDPTVPQPSVNDFELESLDSLLPWIEKGSIAPQCGILSKLTKRILAQNAAENVIVKVVELEYVEHTLNAYYYQDESGMEYATAFDVQNGFLFPSQSKTKFSMVSLNDLKQEIPDTSDFFMFWLPDSILLRKRNLLDDILPCNFLPQLGQNYHLPQKGSPYKYELLGPSFHKVLWFDLNQIDETLFKKELLEVLLENNPYSSEFEQVR